MKQIFQTNQFKRDVKRLRKRGKNLNKLGDVVQVLAEGGELEDSQRDHALTGEWSGSRDCHIDSDWILIYRPEPSILFLERSGSHSDLFK